MVSLPIVKASNARIPTELPARLVAVFAGATTGIGEATLKTFVRYAVAPRIYFLARSPSSAERVATECREVNPKAQFEIITADLSSVKETDAACDVIKKKEKAVNLIVLSMGEIILDRRLSTEGLHYFMGTVYYNRIRIPQNLLNELTTAGNTSQLARVVNIAGGTKEGDIDTSDLAALRIPFPKIRGHLASMNTLALESLAEQAPAVTFIHDFPGAILTPLLNNVPGLMGVLMRMMGLVHWLFARWLCVPIEESGERHVYLATSGRYAPKEGNASGLELDHGAQGSEDAGGGVYTVDWDCEGPPKRVVHVLTALRKKGVKDLVWEHTTSEFERIQLG
ncbi:hypothetical protein CC80DRAFT_473412 [Byssothecium circinans]|uniref:NAD(P)-binding protein n=1 Tax=Byssothecium circinans TaxID=147558 RepID=A0A6A5U0C2_9PLEO|nr:hypothetical protein CC80DRAFT_473412 [Byssothecium circinans]